MSDDYEKIFKVLDEHKQHSTIFREELKVGLNTVAMEIKELSNHQKVANGRTSKLEEAVHKLEKADVLIGEQLRSTRDGNKMISDRAWMIIVGVGIATLVSLIDKFLIK